MKTVVSLIVLSAIFGSCSRFAGASEPMSAEQIAEFRKARADITNEALKNGQYGPTQ